MKKLFLIPLFSVYLASTAHAQIISADKLQILPASAQNSGVLSVRQRVPSLPVFYLQPTNAGKPASLDVFPKGPTPPDFYDNGKAWFDACNSDLSGNDDPPVGCARVGIRNDRVEFGSRAFNGASPLPLDLSINGYSVLRIQPNLQIVIYDTKNANTNADAAAQGVPVGGLYRHSDGAVFLRY